MVEFTVAIPTYNGAQRLPLVLDRLRSQLNTESLCWDILVVDNNSTDQTREVVAQYQQNSPIPIRYCMEQRQGAGFARQRAMAETGSELVGFLDDDNIPDVTWVSAAYRFGQNYPKAGAYASRISGDFEIELPPEFERLVPFFAITQRGNSPRIYAPQHKILPPTAGLVLRRQAWNETVPEHLILSGPTESNMLPGEDIEMLAHMQRSSWEIWYNPGMHVTHKIPSRRLQRDYLIPFFRSIGHSRYVTRMSGIEPWQRFWMAIAYFLNDGRKVIRHLLKHGFQVRSNLVLACEFELFLHSLISPFYLWWHGYLRQDKK